MVTNNKCLFQVYQWFQRWKWIKKSIIPAGNLSESNPSVSFNIHLNSHPGEHYFKDKETKSLLSAKTANNNPKEIDKKKHVITVITQSSKTKLKPNPLSQDQTSILGIPLNALFGSQQNGKYNELQKTLSQTLS